MNTCTTRRILLVDGHAAIRQGLVQVLTEEGTASAARPLGAKKHWRTPAANPQTSRS